jgi:uncharacterized membrane protein
LNFDFVNNPHLMQEILGLPELPLLYSVIILWQRILRLIISVIYDVQVLGMAIVFVLMFVVACGYNCGDC